MKISEMIDEGVFWSVIEESLVFKDQEEQLESIRLSLEKIEPEKVVGFLLRINKFLYDTYTSHMFCAHNIINDSISDDGFEYFRCWVMSRGKEVFYKAKENPDSLSEIVDKEQGSYEFEEFWYLPGDVFKEKTGIFVEDSIDYKNFLYSEHNYPGIEFDWSPHDLESIKKICPKLVSKYK